MPGVPFTISSRLNELLVFAKAPRLGQVKTRLAQTIGEEQALVAYRQLLTVLRARLEKVSHATVCFSPGDGEADLRPFFPASWRFRPQLGGGLGERLADAFRASFAERTERAVIIGSDCPYLSREDIEEGWSALETHDVVFGPTNDGGYWLIGMKELYPELLAGIEWGSDCVLAQSLARAKQLKLKVHLLRRLSDVDTEADWRQFVEARDSSSVNSTLRNRR